MDDSPLAKLPRELRDEIYRFTLCSLDGVTITATSSPDGKPILQRPSASEHGLGILLACKQLRDECLPLMPLYYSTNTFHFSVDVFDLETTGQWRLYASTSKEPYPFIAKAWGEQIGTVSTRLIRRFDFETGVWKTHNNHHNHLVQDLLTAQISKFRDYFMGMGVTTTVTLELQYASKDFCSAQANPAISRLNHFSRRALEYLPLWEKRGAVLAEPAASTPLMNEINAQRGQFIVTLPIGDAGVARRVVGQAMRHEARRLKESQSEGRLSLREYSTLTVELQKCRRQLERLVHDIVIL